MTKHGDDALPTTWKKYLSASAQFLAIFYVATFILGYCFLHRHSLAGIWFALVGLVYVAVVVISAIRMVRRLSMAAIMIAAPTIPLCMMIIVVSLVPVLQAL